MDRHPFGEAHSKSDSGGDFQFISVKNPQDAKNTKIRRLARSHAVKKALESKRKYQQESGDNFRMTTSREYHSKSISKETSLVKSPFSISAVSLDPFQILAAASPYDQIEPSQHKSRAGHEPVFSIADELVLHNFRSIFRSGLDDPALMNATMLTLGFAVSGAIDRECLGYQSQVLASIRVRMASPEAAASESTLGAILLLAGIETRLSMPFQVQLHMRAIKQLLKICQAEGIYLTDAIKRAIFWQDLNASVMTGSSRIIDHTTFAELRWTRDYLPLHAFILPSGFRTRSHLLTKEFIEVLEDIHALQCVRETAPSGFDDEIRMARIDSLQASIQSRLVSLPTSSSLLECCNLAAYLCSAVLRCKRWLSSFVPAHFSSQLLCKLQKAKDDPVWSDHPEVLVWLLHMGGTFAPPGTIRSNYISLLRSNQYARFKGLYESWSELLEILKQFIWSDRAFLLQVEAFWVEISR